MVQFEPSTWDLIVVGAGAAGLLAAARAAERGLTTLLLEKNRKPGVKILISGGTRCNLTHATDARGICDAFGPSGRFLRSALAALGPQQLVDLIEAEGVATKIEPTGKIFPVSNKATDVLGALVRRLERSGSTLALDEPAICVERGDGGFRVQTPRRSLHARKLLITTGGQSYPGCGTTGDGYAWLRALSHTIAAPRPALVPITTDVPWLRALQGITVPDVEVRVRAPDVDGAVLARRRGSLLVAHFGLSGPVVLDVSRVVSGYGNPRRLELACDFLPNASEEELDATLRRACADEGKKQVVALATLCCGSLPRRLVETFVELAELPADRRAAELGKADRRRLVHAMKRLTIPVTGTLGFKKAEVTAGGVVLDEVDSRTMQSKIVPCLYLAGEILDVDGPIGGYNFQAAFSTGWLAAESL